MSKARKATTSKEKKSKWKKPGDKQATSKAEKQATLRAAEEQKIEPMIDDLPQKPSDKLAAIVGAGPLSLRQANQIVWAYVQRMGFQDNEHRHMIRVKPMDGKEKPLKELIGEKPISMFEMTEKLRKHLS